MSTPTVPTPSLIPTNISMAPTDVFALSIFRVQRLVLVLTAVLLTLVLVGLMGTGIWLLIKRFDPFTPSHTLTVRFPNARQVRSGDVVTMAGVVVGHVQDVAVENSGTAARVQMRLHDGVTIPTDVRYLARAELFSVPGGIEITPVRETRGAKGTDPIFSTGARSPLSMANRRQAVILIGESRADITDTFAQLNEIIVQLGHLGNRSESMLEEATRTTRQVRTALSDKEIRRDIRGTLSEAQGMMRDVRDVAQGGAKMTRRMNQVLDVTAPRSEKMVADAAGTLREMRTTVAEVNRVTRAGAPQVTGLLTDARKTLGTTTLVVDRAGALLPTGPVAAEQTTAILSNLSAATSTLRSAAEKADSLIASGQAIVGDPQTAADIKETLKSFRSATQRADQAMATAAPLVNDPTTATDLRETLRSLREVSSTSARLLRLLEQAAATKK